MPRTLKRYYGSGDLHFITFSCYRRLPFLRTQTRRDLFLRALEKVGRDYSLVMIGYVVMPEHVHLLVSEPQRGDLSVAIKALKQSVARRVLSSWRAAPGESIPPKRFWQTRFYDFNVWTEKKRIEKLRYMHRNPVTRGLVDSPEEWRWSSFRYYAFREKGLVAVEVTLPPAWADKSGEKRS